MRFDTQRTENLEKIHIAIDKRCAIRLNTICHSPYSLLGLEPVAGRDVAVDQGLGVNSVSIYVISNKTFEDTKHTKLQYNGSSHWTRIASLPCEVSTSDNNGTPPDRTISSSCCVGAAVKLHWQPKTVCAVT